MGLLTSVKQYASWEAIQTEIAERMSLFLAILAWYGWYRILISPQWDGRVVVALLLAAAACLAPLWWPRLSGPRAILVQVSAALAGSLACYWVFGYQIALMFVAVPLLQASLTLAAPLAVGLAVAASVIIGLGAPSGSGPLWAYHALYFAVTAIGVLVSWRLRDALEDSWRHVDITGDLVLEVRARQEEINQLNKALRVSNGLLKRSLAELALATREAEEARHLKEQFATTVSHELRTPLNIILGFVDVMQQYPEIYGDINWTPLLRRDLGEIQRGARYLSSLVDDILDLARIQALRMPIHREPTDMGVLVDEVVSLAGRLLLQKEEVRLWAEVPDGLPQMYVDQTRIRQVLLNLLANACRFTSAGEIKVGVRLEATNLLVTVSDTGLGIASEQLESIFEEFRQEDDRELAEQQAAGKGLGLAIARRFVQMHGGAIWADSVVGEGSAFHFTLPLQEKRVISLAAPSARGLPAGEYEPAVVLVGDGPGQVFLERHLEGFRVLAAPDLLSARGLAREENPRAIIINTPPPDEGATVAAMPPILAEPVPVVQCSLPALTLERQLFDDWLVKPITSERLLASLSLFPDARRVFLVDDDRAFVRLVRRILEAQGDRYSTAWAHRGDEALEALKRDGADVVLLDIALPGLDGRGVARALREARPNRPPAIVAVTAVQPGLEGPSGSPHSFAVTSSAGFREEDTLALLRACLAQLRPVSFGGQPDQGPAEEPTSTPAS